MKYNRWYVGIKKDGTYEALRPTSPVTESVYGPLYFACIGPFRTKGGALTMEQYGKGNPHLPNVAAAERLYKQHKIEAIFRNRNL